MAISTTDKEITFTLEQVQIYEEVSYEKGLRDAISLMRDNQIPQSEGHAHLLFSMSCIENRILELKIDKLSYKIEELQEKIIRYEKG